MCPFNVNIYNTLAIAVLRRKNGGGQKSAKPGVPDRIHFMHTRRVIVAHSTTGGFDTFVF